MDDRANGLQLETCAGREVAALVFPPGAEQHRHASRAELVELVHGAQHGQPSARVSFGAGIDADGLEQPIEDLAVVELDAELVGGQAESGDHIRHQHAGFGIGCDTLGAHGIGVALHELAETAGAGLLVAPHGAHRIAAVRLGQTVEIFRDVARERRRHIVAQRQPLVVFVGQREHTGVGAILVGQEFAEHVGVFEGRRLQGVVAIALVDVADDSEHAGCGPQVFTREVLEALRQPGLGSIVFYGFRHGLPVPRKTGAAHRISALEPNGARYRPCPEAMKDSLPEECHPGACRRDQSVGWAREPVDGWIPRTSRGMTQKITAPGGPRAGSRHRR